MTLNHLLIGLAAWTAVSIVAGLWLGAIMKHCGSGDAQMAPVNNRAALRKSAA
jgi:hypothetical protein